MPPQCTDSLPVLLQLPQGDLASEGCAIQSRVYFFGDCLIVALTARLKERGSFDFVNSTLPVWKDKLVLFALDGCMVSVPAKDLDSGSPTSFQLSRASPKQVVVFEVNTPTPHSRRVEGNPWCSVMVHQHHTSHCMHTGGNHIAVHACVY